MKTKTETQFDRHAPLDSGFDLPAGAYWTAVGLATMTGGIQLYHYLTTGLVLSLFIGALVLGAVVVGLSPGRRTSLYALGIPFFVGQLFAWSIQGLVTSDIYLADKAIQVLLIGLCAYLLWIDYEKHDASAAMPTATQ